MNIRKRTWTWKGKPNRGYILDGRVGGRRVRKQFPTRQEAEQYRDRLIRERNSEEYGALVDDAVTFADFATVYFAKKPWRTDTYRERADWSVKVLKDTFGDARLTAITPTMIDEYTRTRLKTRAASTVRQELATLSDLYRWAVKLRYADRNSCRDLERPALPEKQDEMPEYLTAEQFGELLKHAGRDVPLYEFAAFTGLRATELLALTWTDIRDSVIVVRRGKGRKQRIIPIVPQTEAALAKIPRRLKEPRIFWWVHSLRHTFGAWCSQSGVDLRVISAAMGHSSVRTTERLYAHLSPDYRRQELQKLGAAFAVGARRAHEEANVSKP